MPSVLNAVLLQDGADAALAALIEACGKEEFKGAKQASMAAVKLSDEGADLSRPSSFGKRIITTILSMASEAELYSLESLASDSGFAKVLSRASHVDDRLAIALTRIEAPKNLEPKVDILEKRSQRRRQG